MSFRTFSRPTQVNVSPSCFDSLNKLLNVSYIVQDWGLVEVNCVISDRRIPLLAGIPLCKFRELSRRGYSISQLCSIHHDICCPAQGRPHYSMTTLYQTYLWQNAFNITISSDVAYLLLCDVAPPLTTGVEALHIPSWRIDVREERRQARKNVLPINVGRDLSLNKIIYMKSPNTYIKMKHMSLFLEV